MPGSVHSAAPTAALPVSLARAFAHSREYPVAVNEFVDGSAQHSLLANASRKRWRLAKRLTPAKMAELRAFFEARKGARVRAIARVVQRQPLPGVNRSFSRVFAWASRAGNGRAARLGRAYREASHAPECGQSREAQ
jgi:hypothetical protein